MKVTVVGGGVGGLSAAWELVTEARRRGVELEVELFESRDRVGGSILTERVDDCLVEGGPDCFITEKPWGMQLVEDLGLSERVSPTNEDERKTFVLWKDALHPLPDGLILLVPTKITPFVTSTLFTWPGKFRMALDLVLPRGEADVDETLGDFIRRRFGQETLDKLGEPLVAGIHSGDPETMSVKATFPRFLQMEQEERSLIVAMLRRMRAARKARQAAKAQAEAAAGSGGTGAARRPPTRTMFVTLDDGVGLIADRLAAELGEERIKTGRRAVALGRAEDGRWELTVEGPEGPERSHTDAVILACPAYASGQILSCLAPAVAAELDAIPYVSSATVTLAYRRGDVPARPVGFGGVIPKGEQRRIKAFTWVTTKFFGRAPDDVVLMRSFIRDAAPGDDEERLIAAARRELADILDFTAEPLWARAYLWPRAMPQYVVGHIDRVERIEAALAELPGVVLAGGAYHGSGIPDTVRVSRDRARELLDRLEAEAQPAEGATDGATARAAMNRESDRGPTA